MASTNGFTKGDVASPTFTLTVDSGTIATPLSAVAELYASGATTPTTSLTYAIDSGAGTATVVGHVDFTAANTPVAGLYWVEIVLTYVDGTRRWPENANAIQLAIRAAGAP